MRMSTVNLSLDRGVHGSAARERRKNNKIINNNNKNKNKMMKTLPKSKDSPTVVGYNDLFTFYRTALFNGPLSVM